MHDLKTNLNFSLFFPQAMYTPDYLAMADPRKNEVVYHEHDDENEMELKILPVIPSGKLFTKKAKL
jgi:hypothetical protein